MKNKNFFEPNINANLRLIRAVAAGGAALGSVAVWSRSAVAGIALAGTAAFLAFEAARGWCLFRACGVKTKF